MYTEAPLVMPRIYAPREYCVKRVKFSQVAEGREAKAIDFDLIVMAGDLLKCTPTDSSPASRKLNGVNDGYLIRKPVAVIRCTEYILN